MSGILNGQPQVVLGSEIQRRLDMVRRGSIDNVSRQRAVGTASLPCVSISKNAGSIFVNWEATSITPFGVNTCWVARVEG